MHKKILRSCQLSIFYQFIYLKIFTGLISKIPENCGTIGPSVHEILADIQTKTDRHPVTLAIA